MFFFYLFFFLSLFAPSKATINDFDCYWIKIIIYVLDMGVVDLLIQQKSLYSLYWRVHLYEWRDGSWKKPDWRLKNVEYHNCCEGCVRFHDVAQPDERAESER